MAFRSGGNSDAKKIMLRLPPTRESKELYALDRAQVKALLTLAETIGWITRHISLPSWITSTDDLQAFADETIKDLMNPLDLCQLMQDNAECFVSSEEFEEALGDTIETTVISVVGDSVTDIVEEERRQLPLGLAATNILDGTECDPDRIYNVIVHVVDFLDNVTQTVFSGLEALTNPVERAKSFLDLIDAKTGINLSALIEAADNLVGNVQEAYDLDYSGDTRQDIICDIFCLFKDSCDLPFWKLTVYYANKFNSDINENDTPLDVLNTISNFILAGEIPGDLVVYAMHSLALSMISTNVPFLGEDFFSFAQIVKAAEDTGDNDWTVFCLDCNTETWCYHQNIEDSIDFLTLSFTDDGYGYSSEWISGQGLQGNIPGREDEVFAKIVLPEPKRITYIGMGFDSAYTFAQGMYAAPNGDFLSAVPAHIGPYGYEWHDLDIDADYVIFGSDRSGADRTQGGLITSIELRGTGSNPFGDDNCGE